MLFPVLLNTLNILTSVCAHVCICVAGVPRVALARAGFEDKDGSVSILIRSDKTVCSHALKD